jgi:hypothetical protein
MIMASETLNDACYTCHSEIKYDGYTENYINCGGYCRRSFHLNCLGFTASTEFWKRFHKLDQILFFCDDCKKLQRDFVMRSNFLEAERSVAGLIEILQTATRDVDVMCRGAVQSVNAAISSLKTQTGETSVVDLVSPKVQAKTGGKKKKKKGATTSALEVPTRQRAPSTSTPNQDDDVFQTPLPPSPKRRTSRGFFGTAGTASQISAAAERKIFVISRVHPSTSPDSIAEFIKQNTGIEDVRCQLMLPKGRTVAELDYVSFKISATELDYNELMKPEIWPAKVLVRDFVRYNRRKGGNAAGFHKF